MALPSAPIIYPNPRSLLTSVMLWWQPPAYPGSSPITGYVVTNTQISYSKTMPANSNQLTVTGLTTGVDYTFAVAAKNANGTGPPSYFKTVQVGLPPSSPTNIIASLVTDNDALVTWSYSQTAGEAPVKYFIITPVPVIPGSAPSTVSWIYAPFSSMVVQDLSTSIEYTFLVQAINDVRYSPYNSFSNNLIIQVSWTPTNILNIQFWFDASKIQGLADGENLTSWADQTGISAVNTAPMWDWPQYKEAALNGLSVIRFNPRTMLLVSPLLPVNTQRPTSQTFFAVSRQTGGLNRRIFSSYLTNQYIGYNSGQKQTLYLNGPPDFYNNTPSDTNWDIISLVLVDSTSNNFYWNGTSIMTSNLANNIDSISLNGTGDTSDCEIAEVIFYNSNLSTEERQVVEGYLAWKWALQANLPADHPYKISPPAVNYTNKIPPTSFISVSQVSATSTDFTISWVGTTGATAFTYTINGQSETPTDETSNSATFSNLTEQIAYSVVITARNLYGQTVSLPLIAYLAPTQPQNISITNTLTNGFTVNWTGGNGATSYFYSLNGIITLPQSDQGTTHGYAIFNGLVPDVNFIINVIAKNTGGQTSSEPFVAQTAPAQPAGLSASNIDSFTFNLNWSPAAGATRYTYQITPYASVAITGTTAVVSNLYPITQYTVSIIAMNDFGATTSPAINVTTLPSVFNPYIVGGSNTPIGAQITWISTTGVTYQYTIVPGIDNAASTLVTNVYPPLTLSTLYPNITYTVTFSQTVGSVTVPVSSFYLITTASFPSTVTDVRYSSATISSFAVFWKTGFATSSLTFHWGPNNITKPYTQTSPITFSTLLSGTAYPVYITAANETGSVSSAYITAYTLPGPTYNLIKTQTTPTSITIGWSGGNGATSYIYTVNGTVTTPSTDNGVSANSATFTGLTTNTTYVFTITPVNDAGVGQTTYSPKALSPYYWFDADDATTFSSTLTNGNTSLVLTWSNKGSISTTAQVTSAYPNYSTVYTMDQINGLQAIGLTPSSFFTLPSYISPLANPTYSVFVIFKGLTQLTNNTSYVFNMNPVAATSRILYKANTLYMTTGQQTAIDYQLTNSPSALLSTCLFSMVINGAQSSAPQGAWFNGTNQPTVAVNTGGVTGTAFNTPNSLGNDSSQGPTVKYDLGEFLIVPSVLNTSDRQNVEGYLAWKWGIQTVLPSNHPNRLAPPSGTWSLTTAPGAPTNLSASAIAYSSFVLYWQGALGATSLTFHVGASTLSTSNTTAPYTISSLSAYTTYPVYMVANSPSGNTSSNVISVQTAPAQPAIFASSITRTSFDLYYSNTTGASSLTLFYNTSSITVPVSTAPPIRVYPVNSGSTYTVYMDAINPTNHTLSKTISVTTQYPPPPAVALGRIGPGNSPYLAYSVDGVNNWTPITYPPWTSITGGVATSGPLYLMILNNDANTLYSSVDCVNWSPVGSPDALFGQGSSPTGVALNGIAYGNGIWIAVVNQWVFASTNDGQTWRKSNQYFAGRVFFANNKFFCESQAINQLQLSTDGLNWSRCVTNMNANSGAWGLRSIVWDTVTSKYIASGYAASASSNAILFWTSPDGSVWTPANQSGLTWTTVNPAANYLTYAFDKWWTTNDSGYALCYSDDNGSTWQGVSPAGLPTDLISLYANGYLVATSPSQGWYYTSDGINWSRLASGNALSNRGFNGYYYIFGTNIVVQSLAPSGLVVGDVTATSFSVSWYGAIGASSLTIHYNSSTITIPANTPSPYTVSPITPDNYVVYITATNSLGQEADSNIYSIISPPSAPQNLLISNQTLTSVDISWSGASNASSLTFWYNTSSITVDALTQPSPYTITNLTSSTSYAFYMVATNSATSISSATVSSQTAMPAASAVTNLDTSNVNASSLSLSWSGGSDASSITIMYNDTPITFPASTPPPYTVSPLSAGSTFTIYIITTNSAGQNTSSNSISVFTPPLSATNLSVANFSISSFAINWAGAQGASSLTFHYNSNRQTVPASQTKPFTISSLTVGSTFTVYIDATNLAGKISSNSITAYTAATPTIQPATAITNSSFQITWSNVLGTSSLTFFYNTSSLTVPTSTVAPYTISSLNAGSTFTVYMNATTFGLPPVSSNSISVLTSPIQPSGVAASNNTNSSFQISWSNAQGASSLTFNYNSSKLTVRATQTSPYSISSLTAGSTYTVYMQATNNTASVSSNNITTYTYPNAPTNVNVNVISYSTLSVVWTGAQGASSLTFYYNTSSLTVQASQTSPYLISSLNAGSSYSIYIDAVANSGLRTSSNSISVLTDPKPAQVLTATNNTPSSFAINWSGAEGASSLTFFYNTSSLTVSGNQTSPYTISSLVAGSAYVIRIDVTEGAGLPISSNQITAYTSPGTTGGLTASGITPSSVSLSWSGGGGASSLIFYYNSSTIAIQTQASPYTLTSLSAGSTYSIYLEAVTASGLRTSTDTISVLTAPLPPTTVATSNPSTTSFQVSWSGAQGASSLTFRYNTSTITVAATQTSPYTLTAVTAGSTYNVSIDATNQTATASSVSTIAYTQANVATTLSYSNPTATSFAIAWSDAKGASSLTFYYNTFNTTVNAATQTSPYTLNTSITAASSYTVYIASNTSGGLVTSSNTVTAYTTAVAPSALVASGITYNSANIAWSGTQGASSLTFYYNTNSTTIPAQASPYTMNTFTAGSSYTIYINTTTLQGLYASSNTISVLTSPLAATGIVISNPNTTSFDISWSGAQGASSLTFHYNSNKVTVANQASPYTVATASAGSTYTVYIDATNATASVSSVTTTAYTKAYMAISLSYSNPTQTSFQVIWSGAQGASSLTFFYNNFNTTVNAATQTSPLTISTSVTAGSTYTVLISSITSGGLVTTSNTLSAYTTAYAPTGLTASNLSPSSFSIAWSNAQGASSLTFYYNSSNLTVPVSQTSPYTISSLAAGSSYTIYIDAVTANSGLLTSSNTISVLTAPLAPTAVTTGSYSQSSFVISWSGAQGASSLTFRYNSNSVTVANQASPYTLTTGLTAGSTYTVSIDATNQTATATSGTTNGFTTAYAATSLTASNISTISFAIAWSGAQGASSLTFNYNSATLTVPASQSSPYTISSLAAATTYTVSITATTSAGYTTNSAGISALTLTPPPPTAITSISTTALTATSVTVGWIGGTGATSYTYVLNDVSTIATSDNGVTSNTATFSSLSTNTSYSLVVTAINAGGSKSSGSSLSKNVAGLKLWLDGSDPLNTGVAPSNGTTISSWKDKSLNAYNGAWNNNGSVTLASNSLNSLSGVYTATGGIIKSPVPAGTFINALTIFVVFRGTGTGNSLVTRTNSATNSNLGNPLDIQCGGTTSNTNILVGPNNATSILATTYNLLNPTPTIFNLNINQTNSSVTLISNGTSVSISGYSAWTASDNGDLFSVGGRGDNGTNTTTTFYEVLVFNTNLTTTTRQSIEGYLAWKWGLQTSLPTNHPYYSASTMVFPLTFTTPPPPYTPRAFAGVPGIQLWFDASDPLATGTGVSNATAVSTWNDKSGYDFNTTATGTVPYNSTTGGLTFDGTSFYTLPTNAYPNGNSAFSVYVMARTNGSATILNWGNFSGISAYVRVMTDDPSKKIYLDAYILTTDTYTNNQTFLFDGFFDSVTGNEYVNLNGGTLTGPVSAGTRNIPTGPNFIACDLNTNSKFNGTIYEIQVYNIYHTTIQRQKVEGYLAWKWGVQAFLPVGHPYYSVAPATQLRDLPESMPGLMLWLSALDPLATGTGVSTGTNITTWYDKSRYGFNTTATGNIPYNSTTGGLTFNGSSYFTLATGSYPTGNSSFSIYMIANNAGGSATLLNWGNNNGGSPAIVRVLAENTAKKIYLDSYIITTDTYTTGQPFLFYGSFDSTTGNEYVNLNGGSVVGPVSVGTRTSQSQPSFIGADLNTNDKFTGTIYEILIYKSYHTTSKRQKVEGYLAWKWNQQAYLPANHPYKNAAP